MAFDFVISADELAEIDSEVKKGQQLTTPTEEQNQTFVADKSGKPGLGRWSEVVTIRETRLGPPKARPDSKDEVVFFVKMEVQGADKGVNEAPNKGRVHGYVVYLNEKDKADPKKAFQRAKKLSVLNSLLSACGADLSQGINYGEFFGGDLPLIGQTVIASFNAYEYASKKPESAGKMVPQFEETGFFPIGS